MATNVPQMRGELPFPDAGEGIVLRFTNPDCAFLQQKFQDNWFQDALTRCNRTDIEFIRVCFEVGAKKNGVKAGVKFDDLDIPIATISQAVLDALFLAVLGRTFEDHVAFMDSRRLATPTPTEEDADPNP
jgi:hypothetical protein